MTQTTKHFQEMKQIKRFFFNTSALCKFSATKKAAFAALQESI